MSQHYDFEEIKALLTEAFTDEDLRRFCYDSPNFKSVYNRLDRNTTRSHVIDRLIEYAAQNSRLETLLDLIKERNPTAYERHYPYYGFLSSPPATEEPVIPDDKVGSSSSNQIENNPKVKEASIAIGIGEMSLPPGCTIRNVSIIFSLVIVAIGGSIAIIIGREGIASLIQTFSPTETEVAKVAPVTTTFTPRPTFTPSLIPTSTDTLTSDTPTDTPMPPTNTPIPPTSTLLSPKPTLTSTLTITSTPIPTPTLTQNLTLRLTNKIGEINVVVGSIETGDRVIDHLLQFGSLVGREVPIDRVPVKIDYGTYFLIPWKAIKTIYKEEEHIVVLTNGQEIRGELDGRLLTDEEKIYELNDILELELIHVPEYQYNVEPGGQELVTSWQLQVREPRGREFVVYNPRFAVEYCDGLVCMTEPLSGVRIGYSITETESFYLKIGDEDLEGPIYFENLAMISSGDINDPANQVKIGGQNDSEIIGTLWGLYAEYQGTLGSEKGVKAGSDWSLVVDYLPDSQIVIVLQNDARYILRKIPE